MYSKTTTQYAHEHKVKKRCFKKKNKREISIVSRGKKKLNHFNGVKWVVAFL